MRSRRAPRVLVSWMAALAVLMAVLAPSISHTLGAKSGASWIEVCSSIGAKWVQAGSDSSEQAPSSGDVHPFEHCSFCSLHADAIGIPAGPEVPAPALRLSALLPTAFLAAPHTLYAWVSAQPRAPPQSS